MSAEGVMWLVVGLLLAMCVGIYIGVWAATRGDDPSAPVAEQEKPRG